MPAPPTREHFWRRLLAAIAPLLVWIAHFAFCYGLAAAQCAPAGLRAGGPDRATLGAATVLALAVCAWLTWQAWRTRPGNPVRGRSGAGLLDRARLTLAVLSTIAVLWTGIPLLLVTGCA